MTGNIRKRVIVIAWVAFCFSPANPAFSCETFTLLNLEDSVKESELIVVGAVLDRGPAKPVKDYGAGPEGGDPRWITIKVAQVIKGKADAEVIKINTDDSCGYGITDPGMGTFVFFLKKDKIGAQYRRVWASSADTLKRGEAGPVPLAVVNGRIKFEEESEWRAVDRTITLDELVQKALDVQSGKE